MTRSVAQKLLFAATLPMMTPQMSQNQKITALSPFLVPTPGSTIKLDNYEEKNATGDPLNLRGFITVNPPQGSCFVIRKGEFEKDRYICKEEKVEFRLRDLDNRGSIHFTVLVDDRDTGTVISWPTPYRIMQYIPFSYDAKFSTDQLKENSSKQNKPLLFGAKKDKGKEDELLNPDRPLAISDYGVVKSCKSLMIKNEKDDAHNKRSIIITFFGLPTMQIIFPPIDYFTAQPPDSHNLFTFRKKATLVDAESKKNEKKEPKKTVETSGLDVSTVENEETPAEELDAGGWVIPSRNTYKLESSNIIITGTTQHRDGNCRYRLRNAPDAPLDGVIECMKTDIYHYFYVPLSCASEIKENPSPDKPKKKKQSVLGPAQGAEPPKKPAH